ncbi:MAG TPA: uroporphyrinogen-III synthase [Candidatus Cybelea sp.]|jgi:uroporphyrinogen-III synthase|nr:uroporphyrinogen-III synthase [Candidatus Cybelea sp.]
MTVTNFNGLTVLTLESRRGQEMSRLIETYGGKPVHAPAMREVPLSSNPQALKFADALFEGKFDAVVFLTGVGARALLDVVESVHPTEKFFEALRRVSVIARGPKPVAVLREWKVPMALTVPEPNTWREVLQAIDDNKLDLRGKQVAVQEYGVSNLELLEGLRKRGAYVTAVPVYQWELPEDTAPLRAAVEQVIARRIDVALFTTSVQIHHLFQIAEQAGKKGALKAGMEHLVKASIGPTTSETLRSHGLLVDLEASHPKMGFLVKEAAEQSEALFQKIESRFPMI